MAGGGVAHGRSHGGVAALEDQQTRARRIMLEQAAGRWRRLALVQIARLKTQPRHDLAQGFHRDAAGPQDPGRVGQQAHDCGFDADGSRAGIQQHIQRVVQVVQDVLRGGWAGAREEVGARRGNWRLRRISKAAATG